MILGFQNYLQHIQLWSHDGEATVDHVSEVTGRALAKSGMVITAAAVPAATALQKAVTATIAVTLAKKLFL